MSDQILSVNSTLNELNVEKQNVLKALYRKLLNVYCQFNRLITHITNCYCQVFMVKWQFL